MPGVYVLLIVDVRVVLWCLLFWERCVWSRRAHAKEVRCERALVAKRAILVDGFTRNMGASLVNIIPCCVLGHSGVCVR